jgi:hypothetical protein
MAIGNIAGGETLGAKKRLGTIAALKSDTVDIAGGPARGVHVNSNGVIRGTLEYDDDDTTGDYTVISGNEYGLRFKRIFTTSTTATGIVLK